MFRLFRFFAVLPFVTTLGFAHPQSEHQVTIPDSDPLHYLLSLPEDYSAKGEPSPLLLFLHGGGESGHDLAKVKKHGPPQLIESGQKLPFVVVSPQNPGSAQFWDEDALLRLLDHLENNLNLDRNRIYLTGLSRGGYGAWRLALENPHRFAALLVISGAAPSPYAGWLGDLPTWVFHGAKDPVIPVAESQRMVDAITTRGGNVRLTVYSEASHDAWTETYANPEVYTWLLRHKLPRDGIRNANLSAQEIRVHETTHLGRDHWEISTRSASYLFDPVAGGFSSIFDAQGVDWIAYRDLPWGDYPAAAASSFRGLPNLIHQGPSSGAGHPGHQKCVSELIAPNQIRSTSIDEKWQWMWTFHPDHVQLDVTRVDPDFPYWFLYEGPAGGKYEPAQSYWGSNQGGPSRDHPDFYQGTKRFDHFNWLYFGHDDSPNVFWIRQLTPDQHVDLYSQLGNTPTGLNSPDGMIVAGFGRADGAKPLLTQPTSFRFGFHAAPVTNAAEHAAIAAKLNTAP